MKIPHILVNSANVLHILPILVNSAMLVNSASINMQYYEYFAYTNGDVTSVQGPYGNQTRLSLLRVDYFEYP